MKQNNKYAIISGIWPSSCSGAWPTFWPWLLECSVLNMRQYESHFRTFWVAGELERFTWSWKRIFSPSLLPVARGKLKMNQEVLLDAGNTSVWGLWGPDHWLFWNRFENSVQDWGMKQATEEEASGCGGSSSEPDRWVAKGLRSTDDDGQVNSSFRLLRSAGIEFRYVEPASLRCRGCPVSKKATDINSVVFNCTKLWKALGHSSLWNMNDPRALCGPALGR